MSSAVPVMSLPAVHKMRYKPWFGAGPAVNEFKTGLIDVFRDLSSYNAKNHQYTTDDGHLLGAYVDLTIKSTTPVEGAIIALPNSWKVRNAVRKFHFERLEMFEKAGIRGDELGRYGKTMRPFFDYQHALSVVSDDPKDYWNYDQFNPYRVEKEMDITGTGNTGEWNIEPMVGGDWDRSKLTASTPGKDGDNPQVDEWFIHLAGSHITGQGKGIYDSVGMVLAYNEDRMEVITPGTEETVVGNNPLALLRSQSITGGAAVDIAEDQELEDPPYDINDGGDSIHLNEIELFKIVPYTSDESNSNQITLRNLWLPAGYCGFAFSKAPAGLQDDLEIIVDVKAVWECRELD